MSEEPTLQQLIDNVVNSAHVLARAAEEFDRGTFKGVKLKAELEFTDAEVIAKLKPPIKAAWDAHKTALAALKTRLLTIDETLS